MNSKTNWSLSHLDQVQSNEVVQKIKSNKSKCSARLRASITTLFFVNFFSYLGKKTVNSIE